MRAAADFNYARLGLDWLKRFEIVAHAPRRSHHRADDLVFVPAQVFRLTLLVSKLTRQSPLRKLVPGLFSQIHLCAFCAFLRLKRLYFETDIRGGRGVRE